MALLSIKRVFKQHASLVVTIPWFVRSELEVRRGDYVVFELDEKKKVAKFYKWHQGVERSYPDYGGKNLSNSGRAKRNERGG